MKMKLRYYIGLIFIFGAVVALIAQFRNARVLSYDMLPPATGAAIPSDSNN